MNNGWPLHDDILGVLPSFYFWHFLMWSFWCSSLFFAFPGCVGFVLGQAGRGTRDMAISGS
jgi:hypothetical protein